MSWCSLHAEELFMWSCWGPEHKNHCVHQVDLSFHERAYGSHTPPVQTGHSAILYAHKQLNFCLLGIPIYDRIHAHRNMPRKLRSLLFFRRDESAHHHRHISVCCSVRPALENLFCCGYKKKKILFFPPPVPVLFKHTALHLVHLMTSVAHELNLIKTPKETRLNCIHAKSNTNAWRVIQLY